MLGFNRFFSAPDPDEFEQAFLSWIKDISTLREGDTVSIDGKSPCGSRVKDSGRAVHIVSAWSKSNQLSLGQVGSDAKSNEITAIPELLEVLALQGCPVTIDATGCQRDITAQNFSMPNRIALNLIKHKQSKKRSVKGKRLDAGWNNNYSCYANVNK